MATKRKSSQKERNAQRSKKRPVARKNSRVKVQKRVQRGIQRKQLKLRLHKIRSIRTRLRQKRLRNPDKRARTRRAIIRPTPALQVNVQQPNLLVTYDPNREVSARQEIHQVLSKVNQSPVHMDVAFPGVMKVQVPDAKAAVKMLREYCAQEPERFSRTFHWTPIDRWCTTDVVGMKKIVDELGRRIGEAEKWKIKIDKRECDIHEKELVVQLTANINKPNVDLQNPERIIKVEILGKETGIALLQPEEYLSVPKMKGAVV